MELYKLTEDVRVIGMRVSNFPDGIEETFGVIMKTLGRERDFYGISWMDENENVEFYAMAKEAFPGEGKNYGYELLVLEKGDYETEAVHNWKAKIDSIKDVLHELMGNSKPDKTHPCIEWYQSDEKMVCMIKALK